jgi:mono/diheme cytochrome c family protein
MPDDAQGNARLMIGEAIKTISKAQIQERSTPISGMPPMTGLLTRQEARDIIAYLVANKEDRTDEGHK